MIENNMTNKANIKILFMLGSMHFINDTLQSLISASYPLLKEELGLDFGEIGMITLFYMLFASILQPIFGLIFDKRASSRSLMFGMAVTCIGVILLATLNTLHGILLAVSMFGIGSSVFHPEASRFTHLASNGQRSLAQSFFQVGGNLGGSMGPLLIALIISTNGRMNILYSLSLVAIAFVIISHLRKWLVSIPESIRTSGSAKKCSNPLSRAKTISTIAVLLVLIFSKYVYMESLRSYYTFYLIDNFGLSISSSQIALFLFLLSTGIGILVGGIIGDRVGRKTIIWVSILGTAPFALLMPYADLTFTLVLSFCSGLMLSSAFSAIVVYAQELLPNRLGLVSGLFFGIAFGISGIASAVLGHYIDIYGLNAIYQFCSFMPLLGVVALLLPNLGNNKQLI